MDTGTVSIKASIEGVADLLMHNGRLADPLDEWTRALKKLTKVNQKTEGQHAEIAKVEFLGGLYWDPAMGIYLPSEALEACLVAGATKAKLGKAFKSAVFVLGDFALDIAEKLTPDQLWESGRFKDTRGVVIKRQRVMRTRPRFPAGWRCSFEITLMPSAGVNVDDVRQALAIAGALSGLGDFRPRFGRFKVTGFEAAS